MRKVVGLSGLEPLTSRLSGVRSDQLSYRPRHSLKTEERIGPAVRVQHHVFLRQAPARRLMLRRKEVIHPHLPVGIPCYDFTPIICPTFGEIGRAHV